MPEYMLVDSIDDATRAHIQCLLVGGAVAMDVEAVDLGRHGAVSIVQLATREQTFVFDVLGRDADDALVCFLRALLEDASIVKIVHDCRMDADALRHCLRIDLACVHDTSCWHRELTRDANAGLNSVLAHHGLAPNAAHAQANVYASNHAYWAARPLTTCMLERAVSDVACLFQIYATQLASAGAKADAASARSLAAVEWARAAQTCWVVVRNQKGFIGQKGANVQRLRMQTNTLLYHRGSRSHNNWVVYYNNERQASAVRAAAESASGREKSSI